MAAMLAVATCSRQKLATKKCRSHVCSVLGWLGRNAVCLAVKARRSEIGTFFAQLKVAAGNATAALKKFRLAMHGTTAIVLRAREGTANSVLGETGAIAAFRCNENETGRCQKTRKLVDFLATVLSKRRRPVTTTRVTAK